MKFFNLRYGVITDEEKRKPFFQQVNFFVFLTSDFKYSPRHKSKKKKNENDVSCFNPIYLFLIQIPPVHFTKVEEYNRALKSTFNYYIGDQICKWVWRPRSSFVTAVFEVKVIK